MASYPAFKNAGVTVDVRASGHVRQIEADPKQLAQVMRNIILNAIQAMPGGGALTIAIRADASSDCALIEFRDTGIGIPNEKLDEIFQPFVTTKTKGTGLGMAIARRIVEAHGGRIAVGPGDRGGAEILVTLPRDAR